MGKQTWTAGAWRALELARRLAPEIGAPRVEPLHLLWALLLDESRAAELLAECGLGRGALGGICPLEAGTLERLSRETGSKAGDLRPADAAGAGRHADALGEVVLEARRRAALDGRHSEVGSEHLLWALAVTDSPVAAMLQQVGLGAEAIAGRLGEPPGLSGEPIATDVRLAAGREEGRRVEESKSRGVEKEAASARSLHGDSPSPGQNVLPDRTLPASRDIDVLRVLDAAANRAREGLRVLEDYVRFVLDDLHLTRLLKEARHELTGILTESPLLCSDSATLRLCESATRLLAARDTGGDVGTTIHTDSEANRSSPGAVVLANFKRVEEAVRTLEEFGKVLSPTMGEAFGGLRYRLYTLEKAVVLTQRSSARLAACRLYVLVTQSLCRRDIETVVRGALAGGVDVVQLREKTLGERGASAQSLDAPYGGVQPRAKPWSDREVVALGRRVRAWTREAGALFVMNDRPDLAVLCDADGVHVGQDEVTVHDARRIVGPDRLVGVSTHTIEQARQAVLDGADYLGVGPVFPSTTKEFDVVAGLDFVRQMAGEITLPWFAIGGITAGNVQDVLDAGAGRVAVSAAICRAEGPHEAARTLAGRLTSTRSSTGATVDERSM